MLINYEGEPIPSNLAVITTVRVMEERVPIQLVVRDNVGDWQFLPYIKNVDAERPLVVAIHRIISYDPTVLNILQLECGKQAWRASIEDDWQVCNYE